MPRVLSGSLKGLRALFASLMWLKSFKGLGFVV